MSHYKLDWKDVSILSNKTNWEIINYLYSKQNNNYLVYYSKIIKTSISDNNDLKERILELKNEGYIKEVNTDSKEKYVLLTLRGAYCFICSTNLLNLKE